MSQIDIGSPTLERDAVAATEGNLTVAHQAIRIFDADQLREGFGCGFVEHRLLEPGLFTANVLRIATPEQSLEIVRYSLAVTLDGAWPEDRIAFLFGLEVPEDSIVHGRPLRPGQVVLLDGRAGINARLAKGTQIALLTLNRNLPELLRGSPSGVPLDPRQPEERRLAALLRATIDDCALTAELCGMSACASVFERDILSAFVNALMSATSSRRDGSGSLQRRSRLVRKAERYVVEHLDESVRMQKLCREVGASARSLEYAFDAIYGTGTMRYLRTVRMNEVRKALMRSGAAHRQTVTAAAMDWGFWHLGEFAAAYKRLFNELPSDTLRASSSQGSVRSAPRSPRLELE
jgi:AraC family ethanolamine operon transcriptional activator